MPAAAQRRTRTERGSTAFFESAAAARSRLAGGEKSDPLGLNRSPWGVGLPGEKGALALPAVGRLRSNRSQKRVSERRLNPAAPTPPKLNFADEATDSDGSGDSHSDATSVSDRCEIAAARTGCGETRPSLSFQEFSHRRQIPRATRKSSCQDANRHLGPAPSSRASIRPEIEFLNPWPK